MQSLLLPNAAWFLWRETCFIRKVKRRNKEECLPRPDLCALALHPNCTVSRWPCRELAMPIAMTKNSGFELHRLWKNECFEKSHYKRHVLRHNKMHRRHALSNARLIEWVPQECRIEKPCPGDKPFIRLNESPLSPPGGGVRFFLIAHNLMVWKPLCFN